MKDTLLLCSLLLVSSIAWGEKGPMCPAGVAGTSVETEDTPRGISVTYVTSKPAQVAELRRQVRAMAQMHESRQEPGRRPSRLRVHVIPGSATVEDVRRGSRIVLEPEDPANLDDLRTHVRVIARMMADRERRVAGHRGECPMSELMRDPEARR